MRLLLRLIIIITIAFMGFSILAARMGEHLPNTVLAYTAICGGEFGNKVYVADWSSGVRVPLPESAVFDRVAWSPDGGQLAYTVDLSDGTAIYARDFRTGTIRNFAQDEYTFYTAPNWSPNGHAIAFFSFTNFIHVAVVDTLTNHKQTFPVLIAGNYYPPVWSPDSESLAVVGFYADKPPELYVLNVVTGALQDISLGKFYEVTYPSWSPDGRYLTFSGFNPPNIAIYLADLQTNTVSQLTGDDDPLYTASSWSPDGQTIATITEGSEVHLFDLQGNLTRKISLQAQIPGLGNGYGLNQVQWSSDGSFLILHVPVNNNWVNYAFDLATGAVHLLSPHSCINTNADDRPDPPA